MGAMTFEPMGTLEQVRKPAEGRTIGLPHQGIGSHTDAETCPLSLQTCPAVAGNLLPERQEDPIILRTI